MTEINLILELDYKRDRESIIKASRARFRAYGKHPLCLACRRGCNVPAIPGLFFACYRAVPINPIKEADERGHCLDSKGSGRGAASVAPTFSTNNIGG